MWCNGDRAKVVAELIALAPAVVAIEVLEMAPELRPAEKLRLTWALERSLNAPVEV